MRLGSLPHRVLEAVVDRGPAEMKWADVKAAAMPVVADKVQLAKALSRLIADGYLCKMVRVTNRARRVFGREEVLR